MEIVIGNDGVAKEYKPYKEIYFDTQEDYEEFERRMEKGNPKEPVLKHDVSVMHVNYSNKPHEFRRCESDNWHCPVCDGYVGHQIKLRDRLHNQEKKDFCEKCGQKIDWSNINEKRNTGI